MTDYRSTDLEGAAYLARNDDPGWDDRPSRADIAFDEHSRDKRGEVEVGSDDYWRMMARFRHDDGPDSDPLFDIVLMCQAGAESEARDTYGDRVVDAAIGRVLSEEGL
jgi:hypothetical protein